MSPRTLLVLMVLFVGLGTFAIFDPLRRKEKAEEEKDRSEHVVLLEGKRLEKDIQAATDKSIAEINSHLTQKEKDLLTV